MKSKIVTGIGELLWDLFPDRKRPGGAPANVIYHAALLGNRGVLVSRTGDDRPGEELIGHLRSKGIETRFIQIDEHHPTGTVGIEFRQDGEPQYMITPSVAWDFLEWEKRLEILAYESDAIIFGTLAQRSPRSSETIRRFLQSASGDTLKVLDLNFRPGQLDESVVLRSLELADYVKINRDEWTMLQALLGREDPGPVLLDRFGVRGICLTRGIEGSTWIDPAGRLDQKAYKPTRSGGDVVGLGDAFAAVWTSELLQGSDPKDAMGRASRYTALLAGKSGAMPRLSRQEIDSVFETE